MKLIQNKQMWRGNFTYCDGYEEIDRYTNVDFEMELFFTNDSFVGTSTDSESKDLFDKPATVKGFIDDEKISFLLNYPCLYYKDDNRQLVLDRESKHPEIHYLGFWDGDKNNILDTWEMIIHEGKFGDDYIEEFATGTFEMRRVS